MGILREFVRGVLREGFDLGQLKALHVPRKKVEAWLDANAEYLGEGETRRVYDTGNGYVIKLALGRDGVAQNDKEAEVARCSFSRGFVPRLIAEGEYWLAVEKVIPVEGAELDAAVARSLGESVGYAELEAALVHRDESADHKRWLKSSEWYAGMAMMFRMCGVTATDLHEEQWGINGTGTLVLLDTGAP